jgi:hypothetical protein
MLAQHREVHDALRYYERRPILPIRKSELVQHRMISDIELSYVIRVECMAVFSKQSSYGASFSAAVELVERSRQLMLPLVAEGKSQPSPFVDQELSPELVFYCALSLLASLPGALVTVNDLRGQIL